MQSTQIHFAKGSRQYISLPIEPVTRQVNHLLPPEVGRYLPPSTRVPFADRGRIAIRLEPILCTTHDLQQSLGPGFTLQEGLAVLIPHPSHCRNAIRIYGNVEIMLLEEAKPVYQGKELSDIICPKLKAHPKDLSATIHHHAPILHYPRVARAGSIDRQCL